MSKLTRMEKYSQLRAQYANEANAPAAAPEKKPSPRLAAPDGRKAGSESKVIEDVLGEVKQYNLENGDLVEEDTQMQILYDLSQDKDPTEMRKSHLEPMEVNEAAGGTTIELYSSSLESVPQAVSASKQPRQEPVSKPSAQSNENYEDPTINTDKIFNPQPKQQKSRPATDNIRQQRKNARKKTDKKHKVNEHTAAQNTNANKQISEKKQTVQSSAPVQQKTAAQQSRPADSAENRSGHAGNIIIGILIVMLLALIALSVFWMWKLGIF